MVASKKAVRVDKWLWAIRIFKTRTSATDACSAGKVRVNGELAKPATKLKVGDTVEGVRGKRVFKLVVEDLIEKRVGAELAAKCYEDMSPVEEKGDDSFSITPSMSRPRGQGRPTKRDRRALDRLRGR